MDPKHELTDEHVTTMDIAKICSNVNTFKTTNPLFPPDTKKEIETLYWKIYGKGHITNNELMVWSVKGWVAQWNGHPINWVIVVVTTAKEKTRRVSIVNKPKVEKLDVSEGSTQRSLEVIVTNDLPRMTLDKDANMFATFM